MESTGQAAAGEAVARRMLGCLLAGAVGDALGAAVEFASIEQIRAEHGPAGIAEYTPAFGRRGAITDDTQMTLFTLEGVIRSYERFRERGIANFAGVVHRAYLRWLYTQGYDVGSRTDLDGWLITVPPLHSQRAPGNTCVTALADGPAGTIDQPRNDSKGCGGVMRVAPVAFPPGAVEQVFRNAVDAAALTHGHPSGYLSAGTLAVIVRELLHGADLETATATAVEELVRHPGHEETRRAVDAAVTLAGEGRPTPETLAVRLGGGWVGEEALAIAICAALCADDLADGLRIAVNHSGDSDSTGAICGNILGARDGVAAIPEPLLRELELRDVIIALTRDAIAEFGPNPPTSRVWRLRYPPG